MVARPRSFGSQLSFIVRLFRERKIYGRQVQSFQCQSLGFLQAAMKKGISQASPFQALSS
jgi:hypothetical protein